MSMRLSLINGAVIQIRVISNTIGKIRQAALSVDARNEFTRAMSESPSTAVRDARGKKLYKNLVKTIEIPNGVQHIGAESFNEFQNLESVTLPRTLETIGDKAFFGCHRLTEVLIPDDVALSLIGEDSFAKCNRLMHCNIGANITQIRDRAFEDTAIEHLVIPASIQLLGERCFSMCTYLQKLIFERRDTGILLGESCFHACVSLQQVTLPDSVTSISAGCFTYCKSLQNITFPQTLRDIGEYAFYQCYELNNIKLPGSLTSIGKSAFGFCYNLREVVIPDGISRLENDTFKESYRLTKVTLPISITSLGNECFMTCLSLLDINLPYTPISIGEKCFADCYNLLYHDPELEQFPPTIRDLVMKQITYNAGDFWNFKLWEAYNKKLRSTMQLVYESSNTFYEVGAIIGSFISGSKYDINVFKDGQEPYFNPYTFGENKAALYEAINVSERERIERLVKNKRARIE